MISYPMSVEVVEPKLNLNQFCDDAIIVLAWWIQSLASKCAASIVEGTTVIKR
jgi:hypothetical protein